MRHKVIKVSAICLVAVAILGAMALPASAATHWKKKATFGEWVGPAAFVGSKHAWVLGESSIIRTSNGWKTKVSDKAPGEGLGGIDFLDKKRGIVVGNGETFRTTDGGKTWTRTAVSEGFYLQDVDMITAKVALAVGHDAKDNGIILKTTNGGKSWKVSKRSKSCWYHSVSFSSKNHGVVVGSMKAPILYTTNGGKTWKKTSTKIKKVSFSSVTMVNSKTGYAVGWWRNIWKTTNGGKTWKKQNSGLKAPSAGTETSFNSVSFVNAKTGWAVANRGIVVHTTNGGKTWKKQSSGTKAELFTVSFTSSSQGWIVGEGRLLKFKK